MRSCGSKRSHSISSTPSSFPANTSISRRSHSRPAPNSPERSKASAARLRISGPASALLGIAAGEQRARWYALRERAALKPGESLVVLGASGGTGLATVELGKIMGARVIACASSDEKLAFVRARGADEIVNYEREDLRGALRRLGGQRGIDVVYDPVGGRYA